MQRLSGKFHIVLHSRATQIQAGTHSAILCKLGNGRHVYMCSVATPTPVAGGHKTLQMHGFPIQTYGKHYRGISLIRCQSKIQNNHFSMLVLHAHTKLWSQVLPRAPTIFSLFKLQPYTKIKEFILHTL